MDREGKAVEEGADAYWRGVPRSDCPYPTDTRDGRDWLLGWDTAAEVDLEDRNGFRTEHGVRP
jgi:hypothetical protein